MKHPEFKQKGAVLLLLLLVFLIAGTSMMLGTYNNRQETYMRQQAELITQMQQAKEALLAFAANSSVIYNKHRGPGFFPCPDVSAPGEGNADDNCASDAVNLGHLPQYIDVAGDRIFFNSYYAAADQQFWYAVAPYFTYADDEAEADRTAANRTSSTPAASALASRLTLNGTDNIVALIFAPGAPLDFQDRNANSVEVSNFLEGTNADADANFSSNTAATPDTFNDQIIAITHDELMRYIGSNAANEIKRLLDEYYKNQPEPKQYPGDLSNPLPIEYHQQFTDALMDNAWLTDDAGSNGEHWATDTRYTLLSPTQATIHFEGCPNMSFTLDYERGVTRNGDSCLGPPYE